MSKHKEIAFEEEICEHLGSHGWVYVEGDASRYDELLSRVVFRGPESGGVLQDSVGEDSSFENKNDLVMRVESPPASAG